MTRFTSLLIAAAAVATMAGAARHQATVAAAKICMILGMAHVYPDLAERLMNAALSFGSAIIVHPPTHTFGTDTGDGAGPGNRKRTGQ